ncbi:hypothetical protein HK405_002518, partial [Cladochytrium tenue]
MAPPPIDGGDASYAPIPSATPVAPAGSTATTTTSAADDYEEGEDVADSPPAAALAAAAVAKQEAAAAAASAEATGGPASPPAKDTPMFYLKVAGFLLILFATAGGIVLAQLPSLVLLLHSHALYRSYIRLTEKVFGSLSVVLTYLFCPGSVLVLTGDHERLQRRDQKLLLFANHQIYPDWLYLWVLSGGHGDVKILMMEYLRLLPILGQGMWFFELIFMHQKWEVDKHRISRTLARARHPRNPLWLFIYPEGTLNTPGNVEKSKAHAAK